MFEKINAIGINKYSRNRIHVFLVTSCITGIVKVSASNRDIQSFTTKFLKKQLNHNNIFVHIYPFGHVYPNMWDSWPNKKTLGHDGFLIFKENLSDGKFLTCLSKLIKHTI